MQSGGLKKLYYSIGEVSEFTGVEPHVLRFWEKEFSQFRPRRGRSGNRTYKERDIKIVLAIKDLLYAQKYTIQGAAERLKIDRALWESQSLERTSSQTENPLDEFRRLLVELQQLVEGVIPRDGLK